MAINGPIRLTGFSGKLDTDSLIKDLMKAERIPLDKVMRQKQATIWQREDYRAMNTSLLSFRSALSDLRLESSFESMKSNSSNTAVLEVTSQGTVPGINNIKVTELARSATLIGGQVTAKTSDPVTADGTVTITGSDPSKSADIVITKGVSTIDSILKDINSKSGVTGVKANFDRNTGTLYMTSTTTGVDSKITITSKEADNALQDVFNLTKLSDTGKNAAFTVNDVAMTSSTNSASINGVSISLRGIGDASISVTKEPAAVIDKIKNFVTKYNELVDTFATATSTKRNRDFQPLTAEEKQAMSDKEIELWEKKARAGTLYNDSLLNGTRSALRSALNTPLSVADPDNQIQLLSEIGITVKSNHLENGKLEIDEVKLRDALNNRFDEVKQLFTKSSDTKADSPENAKKRKSELGIAERLYEEVTAQLDKFTKKIGSGSVEAQDGSILGTELRELSEQEHRMNRKLRDIENRYYKRFSAMEMALQKLESQGSWLASQLG